MAWKNFAQWNKERDVALHWDLHCLSKDSACSQAQLVANAFVGNTVMIEDAPSRDRRRLFKAVQ
jgi:hypothetical protein